MQKVIISILVMLLFLSIVFHIIYHSVYLWVFYIWMLVSTVYNYIESKGYSKLKYMDEQLYNKHMMKQLLYKLKFSNNLSGYIYTLTLVSSAILFIYTNHITLFIIILINLISKSNLYEVYLIHITAFCLTLSNIVKEVLEEK